jgi:hypothetical protein
MRPERAANQPQNLIGRDFEGPSDVLNAKSRWLNRNSTNCYVATAVFVLA